MLCYILNLHSNTLGRGIGEESIPLDLEGMQENLIMRDLFNTTARNAQTVTQGVTVGSGGVRPGVPDTTLPD